LFLAVAFTGFGAISCSSDDDKGSSSIIGKWEITKTGFLLNGNEILEDYEHQEGCSKDFTEFTNDGKMYDYSYFNYGNGCEEDVYESNYSLSGNTLNIIGEEEDVQATILTLNSSTLKVRVTFEDEDEGEMKTVAVFKRK